MQDKTFEELKEIQQRFMDEYLASTPAMTGVGIGTDPHGHLCLKVNFETDNGRSDIPAEFEGVQVITEVVGPVRAATV